MKINNEDIVSVEIIEDDPSFSYEGCDNCDNGLGGDVYMCKAWVEGFHDYYSIRLCHSCVLTYANAEPLDEECENIFEM